MEAFSIFFYCYFCDYYIHHHALIVLYIVSVIIALQGLAFGQWISACLKKKLTLPLLAYHYDVVELNVALFEDPTDGCYASVLLPQNALGFTALQRAAVTDQHLVVEPMLNAGASLSLLGQGDNNAVQMAVSCDSLL